MKDLTTEEAFEVLSSEVSGIFERTDQKINWSELLFESFSPFKSTSLFPVTNAAWIGLWIVTMVLKERNSFALIAVSSLYLANLVLTVYENWLRRVELRNRIRKTVVSPLRNGVFKESALCWSQQQFPHLHTPISASAILQWTFRDGKCVNLPWALLVRGDVIHVKPGQAAPGKCQSLNNADIVLNMGDVLHIETESCKSDSPTPEFKTPAEPKLFRLLETPYIHYVLEPVLKAHDDDYPKPPSLLLKYAHFYFVYIPSHVLSPVVLAVISVASLFRWYSDDPVSIEHIGAILCPLVSLLFPLCWVLSNAVAMAHVLGVFHQVRNIKLDQNPFGDPEDLRFVGIKTPSVWSSVRKYFFPILFGNGEYLFRKENLVQVLGSVTALCCTDKKGILSWPNTSAEKIFLLKADEECKISTEILTITHDHMRMFNIEFDDPAWTNYINYLKPIGLNILLNTCNMCTEENYINFYNHLLCESYPKDDVLPIMTKGCLCELAKKIGFDKTKISNQFILTSQLPTFKHVKVQHDDKFARNLSLARLKFPFPHMMSVMVQERATGARQLFSQGTADIILDSCTDFWTGTDLEPLTEDARKKVLDFYQRASLSSYCTAFSYRPITFPLPWSNIKKYLQLPTHSLPFYWQYSEPPECSDTDAIYTHISLGTTNTTQEKVKEVDDDVNKEALACLEVECNQTFLGMVQLQYQPYVDFIHLIGLLEKACVRFVHFSKENELRSRVFSEKMGLESGWNCHISLKNNNNTNRVITFHTSKSSSSIKERNHPLRSSLPSNLNRPPWLLDFPKWREGFKEDVVTRSSFDSDSDPFEYEMSNRAQLPKGIENIRPHLETMDDVPLLVSLFTDCTPETTKEMLTIMQEYGEIVCVLGSAANFNNTRVFLQADASIAIEPLYTHVCQNIPVSVTTSNKNDPFQVSRLLNSAMCSLSYNMKDGISVYHLIQESRHFVLSFINCMQLWLCCLVFVTALQVSSMCLALPLFLDPYQTLWITLIFVPLLSLTATLGSRTVVMNISTGKNAIPSTDFKYGMWCYGFRFFPSFVILFSCHAISTSTQYNLVFLELYIIVISASFLFRSHQIWRNFYNPFWFVAVIALTSLRIIDVFFFSSKKDTPYSLWIVWGIGALVVLGINELVKRQEIKVNVRHQKRARLEFGTKLGINSPF